MVLCAVIMLLSSNMVIAQSPGFIEQKGQFRGTDGEENSIVQFVSPHGPVRMQLRPTGFSYELWEAVEHSRPTEPLQRIAHPESFRVHRIDIDVAGSLSNTKGQGSRPYSQLKI